MISTCVLASVLFFEPCLQALRLKANRAIRKIDFRLINELGLRRSSCQDTRCWWGHQHRQGFQYIVFGLAELSGICWIASQCSQIFPCSSKRKKSMVTYWSLPGQVWWVCKATKFPSAIHLTNSICKQDENVLASTLIFYILYNTFISANVVKLETTNAADQQFFSWIDHIQTDTDIISLKVFWSRKLFKCKSWWLLPTGSAQYIFSQWKHESELLQYVD